MAPRKLSSQEWDFEVRRAMRERTIKQDAMRKKKFMYYEHVLQRFMPIPYIIGGIAAIAIIYFFGWKEFFKLFLGWIVSLTIIATAAYHLWKHYESR